MYFKPHSSIVEDIATDIKERGLIVLPTVNKNFEKKKKGISKMSKDMFNKLCHLVLI